MPKYLCTVNAQIHITKEITDTIEINAPDEVQAEEDAITAAEITPIDTWLSNPSAHPNVRDVTEYDTDFVIEDI